jgi:hypothetical protein
MARATEMPTRHENIGRRIRQRFLRPVCTEFGRQQRGSSDHRRRFAFETWAIGSGKEAATPVEFF